MLWDWSLALSVGAGDHDSRRLPKTVVQKQAIYLYRVCA